MRLGAWVMLLCAGFVSCQKKCSVTSNVCEDDDVAVLKATTDDVAKHYYVAGLFGVHEKGVDAYQCSSKTRFRGLQNMMAFFWSIDHFQRTLNNRVGDKVYVGGVAYDNCLRKEQDVENILGFQQCKVKPSGVDRRQVMAYVGPDTSTEAVAVGELLKDLKMTSVSHAATSERLTDVSEYPYFLRTVPSVRKDAQLLAEILGSVLRTRYVQLVYQDDASGKAGMEAFEDEAAKRDVCIVQTISAADDPQKVIDKLMEMSTVRYVVIFGSATTARTIVAAAEADKPADSQRPSAKQVLKFLGTSSWGANTNVLQQTITASNNSLVLSLAFSDVFRQTVDGFVKYWQSLKPNTQVQTPGSRNKWFVEYWEEQWGCKVDSIGSDKCDFSKQKMKDLNIDTYVPFTIIAVRAVMEGVFEAAKAKCSNRYTLCPNLMDADSRGQTVHDKIKHFKPDKNYFDVSKNTSDVSADFSRYKIYQVVNGKYIQRGEWQPGQLLTVTGLDKRYYPGTTCPPPCTQCKRPALSTSPPRSTAAPEKTTTENTTTTTDDPTEGGKYMFVKFPRNQEMTGVTPSSRGVARTSFEMRYETGQTWVIALVVLAGLGIFAVLIFEVYIIYKMVKRGVSQQWRTMWLGQLLLLGIFLCYLTLFAYLPVPTKATCGITRFGVGVSYSFCFAVLLVKLMVVLTSKSSEMSLLPGDNDSPNYLRGIYQILMFLFAVGVQVVIDTQWLITVPPDAIQVLTNNGTMEWICNHYTWSANEGYLNMSSFVRTEFENHILSLVYIMFLILITTLLALNAHGIITNHRESIFIGIAAGFSIPLWLAWTLLGGLTRDHKMAHEFGDACIAFGLFLTATLILFAMFLPKVRQLVNMGVEGIYFEDDVDTYYAGSVIVPPSYKSKPSSGIYVNSQGMYSEPVVLGNGDLAASHIRHAGSSIHGGPNVHTYKKAQSDYVPTSKVLRVTPDLTGKHSEQRRTHSELGYTTRSAKGTLKRSRYGSQQNLGAL